MISVKSIYRWIFCILVCSTKIFGSSNELSGKSKVDSSPFTCAGKVIGGYYADLQNDCRMFHVCTIGENGEIRDFVFKCLNGTVFDQETRVCERETEVDCTKSESFYSLNDDLYGPGLIPDSAFRYDSIRNHRQTYYRQKLHDRLTLEKDTSNCKGMTNAIFFTQPQYGCQFYYLCIPQYSFSELLLPFVCAEENHIFDQHTGQCVHEDYCADCKAQNHSHELSIKEAETLAVYLIGVCSVLKRGSFIADSLTGCQQYFQCPFNKESPITVSRCPEGLLFSYGSQRCMRASEVACSKETFSLLKFIEVRTIDGSDSRIWLNELNRLQSNRVTPDLEDIPLFLRYKRGLDFEGDQPGQNIPHESLSQLATVFHRQSSVIDPSGNGNTIPGNGKGESPRTAHSTYSATSPNKDSAEDHIQRIYHTSRMSHSLQPETSLELNKETLNGTVIEVSEIASPDKKGKVTITSVVPKIVNQNGNGGVTNKRTSLVPTAVTNGGTKITLIGSNSPDPFAAEEGLGGDTEEIINTTTPENYLESSTISTLNEVYTDNPSLAINENSTSDFDLGSENLGLSEIGEVITSDTKIVNNTTPFPNDILTINTSVLSSTVSTTSAPTSSISTSARNTGIELKTGSPAEEGSVKTNFTCKDKELEQFYPDIENDCRLFHYCSPGFTDAEVLDLTFVCSGDTKFDIKTKKCQEMSTVVCGEETSLRNDDHSTSESSTLKSSTVASISTTISSSTISSTPSTLIPVSRTTLISSTEFTTKLISTTMTQIINANEILSTVDTPSTSNGTNKPLHNASSTDTSNIPSESTSEIPKSTISPFGSTSTENILLSDKEINLELVTDSVLDEFSGDILARNDNWNSTEVLENETTASSVLAADAIKGNVTEDDIVVEIDSTEVFTNQSSTSESIVEMHSLNNTEVPLAEVTSDSPMTVDINTTSMQNFDMTSQSLQEEEVRSDDDIIGDSNFDLEDSTIGVTPLTTFTFQYNENAKNVTVNTTDFADTSSPSSSIVPLTVTNDENTSTFSSVRHAIVNTTAIVNL